MFVKTPSYDPQRPAVLLSKHQADAIRRMLLHCHTPATNFRSADIQIQIHNPRLSSKRRSVGHATRFAFDSGAFKNGHGVTPRTRRCSAANSPVLTRLLVSRKKLKHVMCEALRELHSAKAMDNRSEELEIGRELRRLGRRSKKRGVEEAMGYLRKLGETLREYYKKRSPLNSPLPKGLNTSPVFEDDEMGKGEFWPDGNLGGSTRWQNKLKDIQMEKFQIANSLIRVTRKSEHPTNKYSISSASKMTMERKKKMKKRYRTTTDASSVLSFAEKMELLAIERIVS